MHLPALRLHLIIYSILLALFSAPALTSCSEDDTPQTEPSLVVEGWIEDGQFPVVYVTKGVTLSQVSDENLDLSDHLLIWAKVTVSDGEQTVILTGRGAKKQFPPYYFTTSDMRGRAGKTYRLTVDYEDYHAEAETTIPSRAMVDSFVTERMPGDKLYQIRARVSKKADGAAGYKFFARLEGIDTQFASCYMGLYTDANLSPTAELPVYSPHHVNNKDYSPYFSLRNIVSVKIASVDEEAFRFWSDYESMVSLSSSPFFFSGNNLRGNVKGALGYWFGYGASTYFILPPLVP